MSVSISSNLAFKIKKYYGGSGRSLPWILIVLGVPLLIAWGFGLILILIGLFMLRGQSAPVADSVVDNWTRDIFSQHDFITRAKEICGFTELVRDPVLLTGFANDADKEDIFTGARIGDDGLLRSTPGAATVILLSDTQIGFYRTGVDFITGNRVNERFIEVFYQDVSSVTVGTITQTVDLQNLQEVGGSKAIQNMSAGVSALSSAAKNTKDGKTSKSIAKLRQRFSSAIVADLLQWDRAKNYTFCFADGSSLAIAVRDGRVTNEANSSNFVRREHDTETAMYAIRQFVRDKKRGFLRKEISG